MLARVRSVSRRWPFTVSASLKALLAIVSLP